MRSLVLLVVAGCSFRPGDASDPGDDGRPSDGGPDDGAVDGAADAAVDAPIDAARACAGYTPNGGSSYRLSTLNASWATAVGICQGLSNGHLAVIGNPTENAAVRALIPTTTRFWLGMGDLALENTWVWLDGSAVDRDPDLWDPGQPNDANTGEDCGEMSNSGDWNDDNCGDSKPYVCECP